MNSGFIVSSIYFTVVFMAFYGMRFSTSITADPQACVGAQHGRGCWPSMYTCSGCRIPLHSDPKASNGSTCNCLLSDFLHGQKCWGVNSPREQRLTKDRQELMGSYPAPSPSGGVGQSCVVQSPAGWSSVGQSHNLLTTHPLLLSFPSLPVTPPHTHRCVSWNLL